MSKLNMSWNKMSIQSKELICEMHAININMAKSNWKDLYPFIKCIINDSKTLKYVE